MVLLRKRIGGGEVGVWKERRDSVYILGGKWSGGDESYVELEKMAVEWMFSW